MTATAYPLCWPEGWRRSTEREYGRFGKRQFTAWASGSGGYTSKKTLTVSEATGRILTELQRFGIDRDDCIISTNIILRLDGLPRSNQAEPTDPGVAVYWQERSRKRCMATDRYTRVADNLAAIAATLEAMRAIERHGGAEILDRAFTGFVALPSPEQWWQVLGLDSRATAGQIIEAHRRLAMQHHPDRGGNDDAMARINAARDQGLEAR